MQKQNDKLIVNWIWFVIFDSGFAKNHVGDFSDENNYSLVITSYSAYLIFKYLYF